MLKKIKQEKQQQKQLNKKKRFYIKAKKIYASQVKSFKL